MAYDKTVIISVNDNKGTPIPELTMTFYGVTEANIEEKLDSDTVKTFDEPVTTPSSDGGYSVDISALEARNINEFKTLKKILKLLKTKTGNITIKENLKHKSGSFDDENFLTGVRLSSNKVKYDAEDLTARELQFNAETLTELVDGEEIKIDQYLD